MIEFISIQNAAGISEENGILLVNLIDGTRREVTEEEKLDASKQAKIAFLKRSCKEAIEAGFYSSALGTLHLYDSALPQDQINLIGAKQAGIDMLFTCTDANGVKWQRPHTASQINQVYLDGMSHIQSNKASLYTKLALVNNCSTLSEINEVT